jgi:hypothetical protein
MDVRLVTENIVSGIVDISNLYTGKLTHIILSNIGDNASNYDAISVKFTFVGNKTHTMNIPMSSYQPPYGRFYQFSEFEDIIVALDIEGVNTTIAAEDNFTSLLIDDPKRNCYTRPLEIGEETLLTTWNLPVGSKLHFNGNDWKNNTSVEYFGIKPTVVYVEGEQVGAMVKNIQGNSTLYYEYEDKVYTATYGNGGNYAHGLTKTNFMLV